MKLEDLKSLDQEEAIHQLIHDTEIARACLSVISKPHSWVRYKKESYYTCEKCGYVMNERNKNNYCVGLQNFILRDANRITMRNQEKG
jgi:hypothetical protein